MAAEFNISQDSDVSDTELEDLYSSVGWTAYTRDPGLLAKAIQNSALVVTARDPEGTLIGLARAISDDATICYLQDIIVRPSAQGLGVGRVLLEQITERYSQVRQTILITDDEPGQRAFYEALGFTEGAEVAPGPVRVFTLLR